ncbi:hypothetical protein FF38_05951 [Lucilia cuprina]|uniref:Uncharacterized protein n=1 Tax=Lucilia cuprina TaxID=7375 RepID=A0A0L0CPN6_LUCCU|nr:hypothetical protein FF38_05951 [Lucilia cuprina]
MLSLLKNYVELKFLFRNSCALGHSLAKLSFKLCSRTYLSSKIRSSVRLSSFIDLSKTLTKYIFNHKELPWVVTLICQWDIINLFQSLRTTFTQCFYCQQDIITDKHCKTSTIYSKCSNTFVYIVVNTSTKMVMAARLIMFTEFLNISSESIIGTTSRMFIMSLQGYVNKKRSPNLCTTYWNDTLYLQNEYLIFKP